MKLRFSNSRLSSGFFDKLYHRTSNHSTFDYENVREVPTVFCLGFLASKLQFLTTCASKSTDYWKTIESGICFSYNVVTERGIFE